MLLSKFRSIFVFWFICHLFQSLFFWMLLSKPTPTPTIPEKPVITFQSLFFWMLLSKLSRCIYVCLALCCFNPYFSGCFSLRPEYRLWCGPRRRFQSLFFWMLLSKIRGVLSVALHFFVVSILIFLDASL